MKKKMIDYSKGDGQDIVYCPVCGIEYSHILEVKELACEYGRGVRIIFHCENGHLWAFRIMPWKGNNTIYYDRIKEPTDINLYPNQYRDVALFFGIPCDSVDRDNEIDEE